MAPPGLFGPHKGLKSKDRKGRKPAANMVTKVHKKPQEKRLLFSCFPAEIQQNIWAEALSKPACHTFKLVRSKDDGSLSRWDVNIQPLPGRYDPSAYRHWKSLLYCKPNPNAKDKTKDDTKHDDKLKNMSFQAGFRYAMLNLQHVFLKPRKNEDVYHKAAAINVETDLVIIEFERGELAPAFSWFEHSTTHMDLNTIRDRTRHFRRVAIHYKAAHPTSSYPGPFHCYCPPPISLGCRRYKACCFELACFLDCFKNLEEFYFVLDMRLKRERNWAAAYKEKVRKQQYQVANPAKKGDTFELSHFFDTKNEYIQHSPPRFTRRLGKELAESPFMDYDGSRECLIKVMKIYRGIIQDEKFANSQEKRNQVKFGLLIDYPHENDKSDKSKKITGSSKTTLPPKNA